MLSPFIEKSLSKLIFLPTAPPGSSTCAAATVLAVRARYVRCAEPRLLRAIPDRSQHSVHRPAPAQRGHAQAGNAGRAGARGPTR